MKVKLLKIVRKRYSITHYPDGVYCGDYWVAGPVTYLQDRNNGFRVKSSHSEKELAYKTLYDIMRGWIEQDYKTSRKKRNVRIETLWYK